MRPDPDAPDEPLIRSAREELEQAGVRPAEHALPASAEERPGARIDRFKLLQQIGEGGFGTVWMAEQQEPVKRKVALKIIKLGMDTRQVVARFEAERQALALMDHPNIAKVLDGGATESGRPYFVMELVKGVPITEYCDKASLSTDERVRLFTLVCRALQHAHQKGIIHRDLKPSNVLVTLHDGVPVPKVIDFGIAKAINHELTSKTLFTEFKQFIGTPEYMSPEQAELSGLDVDTRSDVYSLGVLLYELLTGATPFDSRRLRTAGLNEIQRIIREEDPPSPSGRLSTLGEELAGVAGRRHCEAGTLRRSLRGELDWIVMRALEKDRRRRYETADALGADLERHLQHEPVLAGPPSATYRLRKLVRRNRASFAAAALVVGALVLGSIAAFAGLVEARRSRELALVEAARAQEAAEQALREAEAARSITAFFSEMLASADPLQKLYSPRSMGVFPRVPAAVAREDSVLEMLRRAGESIEEAFAGKPLLEASARETIATTLGGLSRYAEAIPHLERALELRDATQGPDDPDALRSRLMLAAYVRGERGVELARGALEGMQRTLGAEHPETLTAARGLARLVYFAGRVDEGIELFERTLEAQRRVLGREHPDTLVTAHLLSFVLLWEGRAEGEALAREVWEVTRRTLPEEHPFAVAARGELASWSLAGGRLEEARLLYASALPSCRRILGDEHWLTGAIAFGAARSLRGSETRAERERLLRLVVSSRLGGDDAADARDALGALLVAEERTEEALAVFRSSVPVHERVFGQGSTRALRTRALLGQALGAADERAAAQETLLAVALALPTEDEPDLPPAELATLARLALAADGARDAHARALVWAAAASRAAPVDGARLATLGLAQLRAGLLDDALATLRRADELQGGDSFTRALLARVHTARDERAEARAALASARELLAECDDAESLEARAYFAEAEHAFHERFGEAADD